jgi:hypothetical protein
VVSTNSTSGVGFDKLNQRRGPDTDVRTTVGRGGVGGVSRW